MAKTSRGAAPSNNIDALDTLDLEGMFAADGDALFEGFDLDLDAISSVPAAAAAAPGASSTTARAQQPPSSAQTDSPNDQENGPKRRKTKRKTTAPAFFDDLDDDGNEQGPAKKKKRTSKTAPKRGRGKKAAPAAAAAIVKTTATTATTSTTTATATKKTKGTPKMVSPAALAAVVPEVATPIVAAAGQFGGRQKKGVVGAKGAAARFKATKRTELKSGTKSTAPTAPTATAATTSITAATGRKTAMGLAPPSTTVAAAPPSAPHPARPARTQSTFCGLAPSKTLFYPFLPSLPAEVALKNRKVYALLEKLHVTFVGFFGGGSVTGTSASQAETGVEPVHPDEPIFKLTQEAFKEEKNATSHASVEDRNRAIGLAIGSVRKSISGFDKFKLAQDLLSVCTLLRRQHDFVKQNNANMERWCRDHFTEEDFSAVYHDGKKKRKASDVVLPTQTKILVQPPLLTTFKTPEIKVKLVCAQFKEPKTPLLAIAQSQAKKVLEPKVSKKKDVTAKGSTATPTPTTSTGTTVTTKPAVAVELPYSSQPPWKRRKSVAALISRVAQSLESRQQVKTEQRRQAMTALEKKRKEAVDDTTAGMVHTAGMWKYFVESRFFEEPVTDAELQDRVDSVQTWDFEVAKGQTAPFSTMPRPTSDTYGDEPFSERLMDLLVEEGEESETDEGSIESHDNDDYGLGDATNDDTETLLDLSELTENERALIQLRMIGLVSVDLVHSDWDLDHRHQGDRKVHPNENGKSADFATNGYYNQPTNDDNDPVEATNDPASSLALFFSDEDTIESVIDSMKADLERTCMLTNRRVLFVKRLARSQIDTPEAAVQRRQQEASTLAKGAALIKRNKETKAKAGKAKSKQDDDLKLPW